jgi:hypothetical protein
VHEVPNNVIETGLAILTQKERYSTYAEKAPSFAEQAKQVITLVSIVRAESGASGMAHGYW